MKNNLTGKVALITGASSGIGAATAMALAHKGVRLALIARNEKRLKIVAKKITAMGGEAIYFPADICNADQIKAAVAGTIKHYGHLDITCCNAGVYLRCPTPQLTMGQIKDVMETNFYGTLNTAYAVLPYMMKRHKGSIIITDSMDGKKGVPPDGAYVASKFALNGFFQVMRQEVRKSGVHIGMLFPSRIDTPMIENLDCPKITPKASPKIMANAIIYMLEHKKKEMMVPFFSCKLLTVADEISPSLSDAMIRFLKLDGSEKTN